jgi:hypothetical protein
LWGTRPGRLGVFTVIVGALLGVILTAVDGRDPGFLLGLCVVLATAVGSFVVRPRAAYLIIPVPALAYVAGAVIAGYLHDHTTDTSHTALAISAVQWIANGFVAMVLATALAIVVAVSRWTIAKRHSGLKWDAEANAKRRAATAGRPGPAGPGDQQTGRSASSLPAEPHRPVLFR